MKYFLIFVVLIVTYSQTIQASTNRVALVIGNSDYSVSPLRNPENDAESMYLVLRKMGFKVIKGINLSRKQMRRKVREFGEAIKSADVGLFYYAGHGLQYSGNNYLIPVNADIEAEDEIMDESINASSVLRKMESAGTSVNIVILDACRNNPFKRSFRSYSRGLTRIEGPKGSLIAYATAPGSVASDGNERNGLYTQYLVKYMQEPIPLEKVFKKVRNAVSAETNDKQIPWENSSLVGEDFYFNTTVNSLVIQKESPKLGTLIVRSNVAGDTVSINGEKKGSSKLNIDLKPGIYYIEVSKNGYKTFEQSYTVTAGIKQEVYVKLKENTIISNVEVSPAPSYSQQIPKSKYTSEQQRAIDLFNQM